MAAASYLGYCDPYRSLRNYKHKTHFCLCVLVSSFMKKHSIRGSSGVWFKKQQQQSFLCFQWTVQGCCAVSGTGLMEGLDWLSIQVQKH